MHLPSLIWKKKTTCLLLLISCFNFEINRVCNCCVWINITQTTTKRFFTTLKRQFPILVFKSIEWSAWESRRINDSDKHRMAHLGVISYICTVILTIYKSVGSSMSSKGIIYEFDFNFIFRFHLCIFSVLRFPPMVTVFASVCFQSHQRDCYLFQQKRRLST